MEPTKVCPICKEAKPYSAFYKNKLSKINCSAYCKPCHSFRSISYARENKDTIPTIGYSLKRRYGITSLQYEEMLKKQDFKCAICGTEKCSSGRNFAVDHCHTTKKIRGLLCSPCNTGIGQLKDDVSLLKKAIEYLEHN